jgi:hypothetical protein
VGDLAIMSKTDVFVSSHQTRFNLAIADLIRVGLAAQMMDLTAAHPNGFSQT